VEFTVVTTGKSPKLSAQTTWLFHDIARALAKPAAIGWTSRSRFLKKFEIPRSNKKRTSSRSLKVLFS